MRHIRGFRAEVYAKQIPWFIENQIKKIAQIERRKFSVLIISPINREAISIASGLRKKGFVNVEAPRSRGQDDPTLLEGLQVLLKNSKSNLGWRIVSKELLDQENFELFLHKTSDDQDIQFVDVVDDIFVDDIFRKRVQALLTSVRKIRDGRSIDELDLNEIQKKCSIKPIHLAKDALKRDLESRSGGDPAIRNIPIKAATIQGSKGLAAEYVFITQFDDKFFVKDQDSISDKEICNFLVALTRTRRKLFLMSSEKNGDPIFLSWIDERRIDRV